MKITTVLGARPQFIKAAAVSRALRASSDSCEQIVHTGQHFDQNMSDVFFEELEIPKPTHTLGIHSLPHGAMTGRMIEAIEEILTADRPDWLLVYGDTNSTIAGALAATKLHIPVAHVEAGLRSFNRRMPEEINRIATDHIADLLLAPTKTARDLLLSEGIAPDKIELTGDVMYDCALQFGNIARAQSKVLDQLQLTESNFILCTAHRAENTDSPELLTELHHALNDIAQSIPVVLPLHPRTRALARAQGIDFGQITGLTETEPLSYLDMVRLEQAAALILTDSGGVQKEAYFHRVPCVTLRPQTEWTELIETGWNRLCPLETGAAAIVRTTLDQLNKPGQDVELYGDGDAAKRIVHALLHANQSATSPRKGKQRLAQSA